MSILSKIAAGRAFVSLYLRRRNRIYHAYTAGCDAGRALAVNDDALCLAYNRGHREGHTDGYTSARSDGYADGYTSGHADGCMGNMETEYNRGLENGYQHGHTDGCQDGIAYGHDTHAGDFVNGYTSGHADGCMDGLQTIGYGEEYVRICTIIGDIMCETPWPDDKNGERDIIERFSDVWSAALLDHTKIGYTSGHADGCMDGWNGAVDWHWQPSVDANVLAYDGGYTDGHADGCQDGWESSQSDVRSEYQNRPMQLVGEIYNAGHADGCQDGWHGCMDDLTSIEVLTLDPETDPTRRIVADLMRHGG